MSNRLNRRSLLQLAAAGMAVPLLGSSARGAAKGDKPAQRLLIFVDQYGRHGERITSPVGTPWVPSEVGDYELTDGDLGWMLDPVARYRDSLCVLSGLRMSSLLRLGGGIAHFNVNRYALTASRATGGRRSVPTHRHGSIHHEIGAVLNAHAAKPTVYDSLTMGGTIGGSNFGLDGRLTNNLGSAAAVYASAFDFGDPASLAARQVVMKHVRSQLQRVSPDLVQANAATYREAYEESVQSITTEMQLRRELASCEETPSNRSQVGEPASIPDLFAAAYDLFACDLTRSIAFGNPYSGGHRWALDTLHDAHFGIDDGGGWGRMASNYHQLSHSGSTNNANDPSAMAQGVIMRNQIRHIGELADRLSQTPEPDGSGDMMMDNTVLFYHQVMCGSTHRVANPYYHFFLAGKNTNVRRGWHVDAGSNTDNDMWATVAQSVGVPFDSFGGYTAGGGRVADLNNGPIGQALVTTFSN